MGRVVQALPMFDRDHGVQFAMQHQHWHAQRGDRGDGVLVAAGQGGTRERRGQRPGRAAHRVARDAGVAGEGRVDDQEAHAGGVLRQSANRRCAPQALAEHDKPLRVHAGLATRRGKRRTRVGHDAIERRLAF